MRTLRWWALLTLASVQPAAALDPSVRFHDYVKDTWSIEQGLPQISVLAIAQGPEGYVWVGTQAGVARFDGVRFETFTPDNTPELPGVFTQALLRGRDGVLWIGTYKGLARYRERRFERITLPAGEAGLDVRALTESPAGEIFASGPEGTFRVQGDRLERVPGAPDVPGLALLADADGLTIGSNNGVYRVADGTAEFTALGDGSPLTVTRLARAHGALYAGTSHGLYVSRSGRWSRFDDARLGAVPIDVLYLDGDDNLWVGATDALLRLRRGRLVERIPDDSPSAHRAARALYEDREGSLWIGSQWEGLARLWNGWARRHSVDEGLHDPIVWSVAADPAGGVWVGSNDGLARYDRDTGFRRVLSGSDLPHPNAYTLLAEPDRLWIGTRRGMAVLREGRVERPEVFAPLANLQVNGFLRDRAGVLWIATLSGLFRLEAETLTRFGEDEGLRDPRVRLLHETADGVLLLGTQDGLFEWKAGRLERVGEAQGLPAHLDITAIHELEGGQLVVGTLSDALYHFDGERWSGFGAEQGLPDNSAFFITHDAQGWLWVAGIRGVYRLRLDELLEIRRGQRARSASAQMLLSERGDQPGSQKGFCCNGAGNGKGFLRDDRVWLPTRGGVVELDSDWVHPNPVAPTIAIERVDTARRRYDLQRGAALELPLGERNVVFRFTALSFQQPNSVRIETRLQGFDDAWRPLGDPLRRDATYTNLPPGDYRFEVRAANNAGVWSKDTESLALTVPAHFVETRGFYLLVALTLIGAGFLLHRLRTLSLRNAQAALEAQIAQRTRELAEANQRLQDMSFSDALTGLRNRRYLTTQLPADVAFYLREVRKPGNEGLVMLVALIDIDHFKSINDRHGHRAGDLVLQQFARLLEAQVRRGDYVVRWGGEEFLLVFRPMPWQEVTRVIERTRASIEHHAFDIGQEQHLGVTASIGFVEYPLFRDVSTVPQLEKMIELADKALYWVKSHGRNGWATYRPSIPMRIDDILMELEARRPGDAAPASVTLVHSEPRRD